MNFKRNSQHICITLSLIGVILLLIVITGIHPFKRLYANDGNIKKQIEVKNISARQARELIDNEKDVFVLDVRTVEEYNEAHIKGATLIPIQELEKNLEHNIDKIPKDKKVVVHCAAGKRSAKACQILKDKGLKQLYNVEGGIRQWQAEGYPVEKP